MRSFILFFLFIVGFAPLSAQTPLRDWHHNHQQHTRRAMWVLGGWAAANIAVGAIGMSRSKGENRAFHQMNLGWGAINLGLAASGIWTASQADPAALDAWTAYEALQRTQKLFLFNAGLDVGYVMAGVWMQERAKTAATNAERWRGFGKSIIIQGAFLFAFDLGAYLYHQPLDGQFQQMAPLPGLSIGTTGDGVGLRLTF